MQVRVKLMGVLKSKSPPDDVLDLSDESTINDLLSALGIDASFVQIVMVNNRPQPNRDTVLAADDELTVLAPVGGG